MIDKAIEKLTKEMMKLNNPFAQAIEEHLTEICTSDAVADKILQEGSDVYKRQEERCWRRRSSIG